MFMRMCVGASMSVCVCMFEMCVRMCAAVMCVDVISLCIFVCVCMCAVPFIHPWIY